MVPNALKYLILLSVFAAGRGLMAQDFLPTEQVDSSFVGKTDYDWTVRLIGTYKYENLRFKSEEARLKYRPVDPLAAGFGFSYKTWVVDLGIRINSNTARDSERFDFRTSALLGPHLIDLGFLYYKGFEESTDNFFNPFRDDIRTLTITLDYLYFPNVKKTSFMGSQTGLQFQKKSIGSPLVGGFLERHQVRGDSSLVPDNPESRFNNEVQFERFNNRSAGVLFGYAQFQRLTENLYGAAILTSGIGAWWGRKWYATGEDDHVSGAVVQINAYAALGYNWNRIYAFSNYSLDVRLLGFGEKQSYSYQLGRIKIGVGYKLFNQ